MAGIVLSTQSWNKKGGKILKYKYTLSSTNESSRKYGPCEICCQHASEVFIQTEYKRYEFEHNGTKYEGWKLIDMNFGHKECLLKIRKNKTGGEVD